MHQVFALAGNDMTWYPVVLEFAPDHAVDRYMGVYMSVFGFRALLGGVASATMMELSPDGSRMALLAAAGVMALGVAGMVGLAVRMRRGRAGG